MTKIFDHILNSWKSVLDEGLWLQFFFQYYDYLNIPRNV